MESCPDRRNLTQGVSARKYDFIFTLLATKNTHGHHKAAALSSGIAGIRSGKKIRLRLPSGCWNTQEPPGQGSQSYQSFVNKMMREHHSQGAFLKTIGVYNWKNFDVFEKTGAEALLRTDRLFKMIAIAPDWTGIKMR